MNESYKEFITNLKKLLDQYFPLVKLSRSKAKNKPFVTPGIKVSIRHRDKLHQKYLNNKMILIDKFGRNIQIKFENYSESQKLCFIKIN